MFKYFCLLAGLSWGWGTTAFGQLQWSSYDTSGQLVTANVATGGDLASASSVTFTIPANTQLFFVTKNFTPFSIAGANARMPVTFKVSASGGSHWRGSTHDGLGSIQFRRNGCVQ